MTEPRDLTITMAFSEEEARFLGGVCADMGYERLTEQQREIMQRISGKFLLAGEAMKRELVEALGLDEATRLAERCLEMYPDVDVIAPE